MSKKRLGNVGVLDLRTTTPAALDNIEWIDNVGAVLVSEETETLLTRLAIGNLGGSAKVPKECKLVDGELELNHAFFAAGNMVNNLVNGTLKIQADVTQEDLEQGITFLAVNGLVFCPRDLIPALQGKADFIKGQLIPLEENAKLLMGKCEMNRAFCQALNTPTRVLVIGNVDMTDVLTVEDVQFIDSLEIVGALKIAEENLRLLGDKLRQTPMLHINLTVPSGYTYLKQPLTLNTAGLQRFNNAKLFTGQRVVVEKDVTADALQQAVSHLQTSDYVICPVALQNAVLAISDVGGDHLLTFADELVTIEGQHTLTAAELKYRPPRFALLIDGKLDIASDVPPDEFFQRVTDVFNFGKIAAGDEICGILQVKSKTRKGAIQNLDAPEVKPPSGDAQAYLVQNVGYLKI